jgi:hypothetical protein
MSSRLTELYNEVSRRTDTDGTQINVSETKRVLACFFDLLEDLTACEAAEIVAKGLQSAKKRRR